MRRFDVSVVGELNLDLILYGVPEVLDPEREVLVNGMALTLGSSSAIFAHNLAALGSKVGFISRIGNDSLGQNAIDRLSAGGVDVAKVRRVGGSATTGLTVILSGSPTRRILTYPGTMNDMCFEDLDLDYLADARHFHLSSFFLHKALRPRLPELFKRMKDSGLSTSLDTNDDPEDRWADDLLETLKFVDVFLPNAREARKITRTEDLESAIDRLSKIVPVLVVKMGPEGAMAQRGTETVSTPALRTETIDPVGAGDSFDAGFLHQYIRGANLETCLAFGNLAGAFSTTRPGGTEAFRDRAHYSNIFDQPGTRTLRHD
jgi:sugar/nucleoside kinase (ribokinase family)